MPIPDHKVDEFRGLVTDLKDQKTLPKGSAVDSLNWLTFPDGIELRRGYALLGQTRQTGVGKITGLVVGKRIDGVEVPFITHGRKIRYYNSAQDDFVEVDTANILPAAANSEDVAGSLYTSLAGAFVYLSGKNSSIYKVPAANPASVVDQLSTSHRGKIFIKQGRTFLWDRKDAAGGQDQTGLYGSYIDRDELSDYTAVTAENVGTGNGVVKTFAGTLGFKAGGSKRTCMYVSITDSVETFRDDRSGNLVGSLGGTGTINYATGAFSVTFNSAPANLQAITADYYWEDSTVNGICDFSKSTPRTAGQGFVFRQDDGGIFQNLFAIGDAEYCMHEDKTWKLTLTKDDTQATNLTFRRRVGIPHFLAAIETAEGIPYVDVSDEAEPRVRILAFAEGSTEIESQSLSLALDLSDYRFDQAVLMEWGDYLVLACRHKDSPNNNTFFVRNKRYGFWDRLDYWASRLGIFNGTLIAGDSVQNNVWTLFSGVDDDGAEIPNYRVMAEDDLNLPGLKRFYIFEIDGLIGPDQKLKISLSYDSGPFVEIGGSDSGGAHTYAVQGNGSYVDRSQAVYVGALTIGRGEAGGGGTAGDIPAFHFRTEVGVASDIFEYVRVKFEAVAIGFCRINSYKFKDIRYKGRRIAYKYGS